VSIPIDVRDLIEEPGAARRLRIERPVEGLKTELVQVPADAPVRAELLLESVVEGILASGELTGTYELTCARCLTSFEGPFRLDVQELFAPDVAADDAEQYPLAADGQIDLEPMVRDVVVLTMPYSPLCRPDCRGLCERCGGNRNLGECICPPATDPMWAPLAGLVLPVDDVDPRSN
jgi:uncharacterized protein